VTVVILSSATIANTAAPVRHALSIYEEVVPLDLA
jgi:hypothetical protein